MPESQRCNAAAWHGRTLNDISAILSSSAATAESSLNSRVDNDNQKVDAAILVLAEVEVSAITLVYESAT